MNVNLTKWVIFMKDKQKISGPDVGIIASVIGIMASILVIVLNLIDGESIGVGIGLLCFSIFNLALNFRNKKSEK